MQGHPYLKFFFDWVKKKHPDIHTDWVYRDFNDQEEAFASGRSRDHFPNSKHNFMKGDKPFSLAIDLFVINEDGEAVFPGPRYRQIADEMKADKLLMKWGGDFVTHKEDQDHFELHPSVAV
jgi:hypothetical protein